MSSRPRPLALLVCALTVACGGGSDGGGGTGATGSSGGGSGLGSSGGGSTSAATTGTSAGSGTAGSGGGSTAGSGGSGTAGSGGSTGGSGGNLTCDDLVAGPLAPELVTDIFDGSEDLAFDGLGNLAAKDGNDILLMDAAMATSTLASVPGETLGLRFGLTGDLFAAQRQQGKLVRITPGGQVSDFATGLGGPNGVYPDLDGNIWVTDFSGDRVLRLDGDATVTEVVTGAEATLANGVVYDPGRGLLYYTNYGTGRIASVTVDGDTFGAPQEVATIPGAPDGMVMDSCGNLYVVDQQGSELYRIALDLGGAALGAPVLLASYETNVANPQFGRGPGFCDTCIYTAGKPGRIYRVDIGLTGAAIP